jgi:hypothetical protein
MLARMKFPLLVVALTLACSAVAEGWRFTIPAELIDPDRSVCSPGNRPPTVSTNGNVEIIDWTTALTPTPEEAEFLLRLRQPMRSGTVLYYGAGELTCALSNEWRRSEIPAGKQRRLALVAWNSATDGVRIVSAPSRQPDNSGYQANVPFLTVLPVPAKNVASGAKITSSSGQTERLHDGILETNEMFRGAPEKGSNAWIVLQWPRTETIRGLGLFGGAGSTPLSEVQIQYAQNKEGKERWVDMEGRPTGAGLFRANQFFIAPQQITTTAVRLSQRKPEKELALTEIVVLQDMRKPSEAKSSEGVKKER